MSPEPSAARHVAIVVLTRNGREDTLACLESLAVVRWSGPLTTIVVDNGSADGTLDAVRAVHPGVRTVRSEENLGYAGGNNLGIRHARELGADDVLVLNNDTEVDPGLVEALERALAERPGAGALCPLILYADPPGLVWFAGARFDPRRGHHGRHEGYKQRDDGRFGGVRETERASGCAVLFPLEVLEEVGAFDEALFLYYEDTELSLRLRAAGRRIYVVGEARVLHKVSATAGGEHSPDIAYYGMRNLLAICRRHAPLGPVRHVVREAEAVVANLVHARRGRRPARNVAAVLAGWRDYHRGRFGSRHAPAQALDAPAAPRSARMPA